MRSLLLLVAATSRLADAAWLRWSGNGPPIGSFPQETGDSVPDGHAQWTPKPTAAPGLFSESHAVLELLRKQKRASSNTWLNDHTCGYFSGTSSSAYTCASDYKCATNDNNVVACVSGPYSPFFEVCLDHSAFLQGACESVGSRTGCCESASVPACGTYIWSGQPARSSYECLSETTVISMIDQPQFVLDAATRTTASSRAADPTTTGTAPTTSEANQPGGGGSTSVGVIVGAIVGGIGALALLLCAIACLCLRRRRRNKSKSYHLTGIDKSNNTTTIHKPQSQGSTPDLSHDSSHQPPPPAPLQTGPSQQSRARGTTLSEHASHPGAGNSSNPIHPGAACAPYHPRTDGVGADDVSEFLIIPINR